MNLSSLYYEGARCISHYHNETPDTGYLWTEKEYLAHSSLSEKGKTRSAYSFVDCIISLWAAVAVASAGGSGFQSDIKDHLKLSCLGE